MEADGSNATQLSAGLGSDPDWSPDGTKITYVGQGGGDEIFVMNVDGTNPVNLTNNAANDAQPSWSPLQIIVQVTAIGPTANALNINAAANISISFSSADINPTTLNNNTIKVNGSQSGLHTSSNITYDSSTKTATFNPDNDFLPGEVVNVTLTTEIESPSSGNLVEPYTWSFTIGVNGGSAEFTKTSTISNVNEAGRLTAGDFDRDGDIDLVATNTNFNTISILLNDGAGNFATASTVDVGGRLNEISCGDFDGDGDLDLAAPNSPYSDAGAVSILKNDGAANFVLTLRRDVGYGPMSVTPGDYDGDGDLDLAVPNNGQGGGVNSSVVILTNDGRGTFNPTFAIDVPGCEFPANSGDWDGDGDLDLAVASHCQFVVSILMNDGSGIFSMSATVDAGWFASSVAVGDLDSDGDLDLVIPNRNDLSQSNGTVTILKNDGHGNFTRTSSPGIGGAHPNSVAIGDFDHDGDLDLAVNNPPHGTVSIMLNDGAGNFSLSAAPDAGGPSPDGVLSADFDSDGDLDLAATNSSLNTVSILKNISNQPPVADAGADRNICAGDSVIIGGNPTATGGNPPYDYSWTPTVGLSNPFIANPKAAPNSTTEYAVEMTDAVGNKATDLVIVTVNLPPTANAGDDREIVIGASATLGINPTASGGAAPYTFSWTPATGLDDPSSANPVASPANTTTYLLTLTDANGCRSTDEVRVTVHDFVLFAADYVKVNRNLDSEGNIHSNGRIDFLKGGPSKHTGNLTAVGNITIKTANTIEGDATAGGQVLLSGDARITGVTTGNASVATIARPILSFSAGGANKTVARNSSMSISPGTYGTVTINSNGTLYLGTGEYFISTIDAKSSAKISCDVSNGTVKINLAREIKLATRVQILATGGNASANKVIIATQQRKKLNIGKDAHIQATLLAPLALVNFGAGSSIKGSVCADSILTNTNVSFRPHNSLSNTARASQLTVEDEIESEDESVVTASPSSYSLSQNYPNPFNASTTIRYEIPNRTNVQLEVIDALGRQIAVLVNEEKEAGYHEVDWQANDIASGVYFYRLKAGSFVETKKLILLR
ncbi:MAG: FG-GAP-like repeat-containing protein, partial [Anaerolineae bacterium]|nr:FG-GAP-like repeat-containing protein [Anaerolineae bacterium]